MNSFYRLEHILKSSETDSNNKMRIDNIVTDFQDITVLHSVEMGVDGKTMQEKSNAFWVLTKVKLKIASLPLFDEKIEIETWPLKATGIRFERDYIINRNNERVIKGSSEWCVLDFDTQKLRRGDSVCFPQDLSYREDRSGAGEMLKIRETVSEEDINHTHRSSFVDIDSNKHTNNIAYLRMTLNCFTPEEFDSLSIDEFQINFLSQTFYGDEIAVYKKKTDYGYFVEGQLNGKSVFNSFILLKK